MKRNNGVLLGLSGGVDSTAAVILLQKQGMDVTGCFIDVTGRDIEGRKAAEKAAKQLGISLVIRDVSQDFSRDIIDNFCKEYSCGRTPSPCVICNPLIKFRVLKEEADRLDIFYIATGHYANVEEDSNSGVYYITKAVSKKDQSYMLYRLSQPVLSRLLLPLGNMESKDEIRQIAKDAGIFNAEKKDSMEVCFLENGTVFSAFLRERGYESKKGNFVTTDGRVIAPHTGIADYTIGQRKGLGIAIGKPAFVTSINADSGDITIGDNDELFTKRVFAGDFVFVGNIPDENGLRVQAKIRYAASPEKATVFRQEQNRIRIQFDSPVRAATPGQSVVFYSGNRVIGGGIIL